MKRLLTVAVTACLLITLAAALGGCGMSRDAAANKVKAHLEEKYGEEFVVEASGGGFGTSDNTTWKVIFHPASNPTLVSFAVIPKSGGDIRDYYTGNRVARDYSDSIASEVAELAGGRVFINSEGSSSSPDGEVGGRDVTIEWYFEQNPDAATMLGVLTDADLTPEAEDELISRIGGLVAGSVPNARVYLATVDPTTYDEMLSSAGTSEFQDIESASDVWVVITHHQTSVPERL